MAKNIFITDTYDEFLEVLREAKLSSILLVCGKSARKQDIYDILAKAKDELGIKIIEFNDFDPNPKIESAKKGVQVFEENCCDSIMSIGGGSAIDVAKTIKYYSKPDEILHISVPTTAGSGSEKTQFAVIYENGEKISISDARLLPEIVIYDNKVLSSLPLYQKKSTSMDALSHAIESYWSVNSTDESKNLAKKAIELVLGNIEKYIAGEDDVNGKMFLASDFAGQAINITKTTAGHAMCYKLTTKYGISHGHAASLCNRVLWKHMIQNTKECADPRGTAYLDKTFNELSALFGGKDACDGYKAFAKILEKLSFDPIEINSADYEMLSESVNLERLKNNPVVLSKETLMQLYGEIK